MTARGRDAWKRALAAGRLPLKVCCIRNADEARLAARVGASAVGLVGPMPSGPGTLTDDAIASLVPEVPSDVLGVLLTCESTVEGVLEHLRRTGAHAIQLTAPLAPGVFRDLRAALPDVWIAPVVHVEDERALDEARDLAREGADAVLLDSGRPSASVPELGGTGRVHDWRISRRVVEATSVPVLLAGGLGPHNVAEAWREVGPSGLDVCSGLRPGADRALDERRLVLFAEGIRAGAR